MAFQPAAVAEAAVDLLVFAFERAALADPDQRMALVFPEPVARVAAIARAAAATRVARTVAPPAAVR